MLIDSHCHVQFNAFKKDSKEVIEDSLKNKVEMIVVGTNYKTSQKAVELASSYKEGVYASIGVHPIHLLDREVTEEKDTFKTASEVFDKQKYLELGKSSEKVVAIGEIGLDYHWIKTLPPSEKEAMIVEQRKIFIGSLELARELGMPVIIHCRDAHNDLILLLEDFFSNQENKLHGVIHSFTGNQKQAAKYLELGFMLGFNGIITYSDSYNKVILATPKDHIIIETDCPYLTPAPLKREDRNVPKNVSLVADKIADVLDLSSNEVANFTTKNAKKLFGLNQV